MKVVVKLPNPTEATWKLDQRTNELTITPLFYPGTAMQVIGYIETAGEAGAVLRGTLRVSGRSGRVINHYPKGEPIVCEFDKKA